MATRVNRAGVVLCGLVGLGGFVAPVAAQTDARPIGQKLARELGTDGQDLTQVQDGLIRWAELNKPGLGHEYLATFVGEWDCEMKVWMDPKAPPMTSTGSAVMKLELGGRVLTQKYTGTMGGQPFEGIGQEGYDNVRNLFWSTWTDSLSTSISTLHGSLDETGSVLTYVGQMDEPLIGQYGKAYMTRVKVESADRHVFEVMEILYGEPFQVVEITYTRK